MTKLQIRNRRLAAARAAARLRALMHDVLCAWRVATAGRGERQLQANVVQLQVGRYSNRYAFS